MSILTPLPEYVKAGTHLLGCTAIFVASHRQLGRWRAVSSLNPPPDTAEALDQAPSPSREDNGTDQATRDEKQPLSSAEMGAGVRARSSGSSLDRGVRSGGGQAQGQRLGAGTQADISSFNQDHDHSSVVDESEIDHLLESPDQIRPIGTPAASNSNNKSESESAGSADRTAAPAKPKESLGRKIVKWFYLSMAVLFFLGSMLDIAYTSKWIGDGIRGVLECKQGILALFLGTTWFRDLFPILCPRPILVKLVHRKPIDSKKPYEINDNYPEGWKNTYLYKDEVRVAVGAVASGAMVYNAYSERYDYMPFLAFAVTVSFLKVQWAGPFVKMRWVLALVTGVWSVFLAVLMLATYMYVPIEDRPKTDTVLTAPYILPIMMAPCAGIPYALPGLLISTYHRYEDTHRNPVPRTRAPGVAAPVESFKTRNHPRTTACILALFAYMRGLEWWLNGDDRSKVWEFLPFYESIFGVLVVLVLQVAMELTNGTFKRWFVFEEQWCPTEIVSEVGEKHSFEPFTDEK